MAKARFQVGDIIDVTKYLEQEDNSIRSGICIITGYTPPSKYSPKGTYDTKVIKGNITFIRYGALFFDESPYLVWIGNINDNPILKLLYGEEDHEEG